MEVVAMSPPTVEQQNARIEQEKTRMRNLMIHILRLNKDIKNNIDRLLSQQIIPAKTLLDIHASQEKISAGISYINALAVTIFGKAKWAEYYEATMRNGMEIPEA